MATPAQAATVCVTAPNGAPVCFDNGQGDGTGNGGGGSNTGSGTVDGGKSNTPGAVPPPPVVNIPALTPPGTGPADPIPAPYIPPAAPGPAAVAPAAVYNAPAAPVPVYVAPVPAAGQVAVTPDQPAAVLEPDDVGEVAAAPESPQDESTPSKYAYGVGEAGGIPERCSEDEVLAGYSRQGLSCCHKSAFGRTGQFYVRRLDCQPCCRRLCRPCCHTALRARHDRHPRDRTVVDNKPILTYRSNQTRARSPVHRQPFSLGGSRVDEC